ncbi:MAG: DUF3375 domain-containing protein [Gammaproteobacteria bacterium]
MDFDYLTKLRQHPTWRLLNADHAALILSFFYRAFIQPNNRSMSQSELTARLDDYLFHLREIHGEKLFPRAAQEYLDDWASGENAYLRKYYPPRGDEPEFDLTPASEKAVEWLTSLEQKQFIGTESRLLTVFQLLESIVQATENDPSRLIAELEKQKAEIERKIERLARGRIEPYDPTRIKERFYQAEDTARRLLLDFRQVEENFRVLDRRTREKIATSTQAKGDLLDEIFGEQDVIQESDQGKSFRAFWTFLMSPARQQELNDLIQRVLGVTEIQELKPDELLPRIKFHLLEAGEKVQRTGAGLVEQLRRYLDDQVWLENKRIMNIIHEIEKEAVTIRQDPPSEKDFMHVDDFKPSIEVPMSRTLFRPAVKVEIDTGALIEGRADFASDALFDQHYVDEALLRRNIRKALQQREQIELSDLCRRFPLEKGLSEVVAYLNIASKDANAVIDSAQPKTIGWTDVKGHYKQATLPCVIFTRRKG